MARPGDSSGENEGLGNIEKVSQGPFAITYPPLLITLVNFIGQLQGACHQHQFAEHGDE
ncbi:hypothetical protein D3C79_519340 [compost metagenome]